MPQDEYIGRVQIDNGAILPVGSTLFGICNTPIDTANKEVPVSDATLGAFFKTLSGAGVTVHIQFTYGNSIASGLQNNLLTLKIGSTLAKPVICPGGSCIWSPNAVISFTYDGTNWVANDGTLTSIPIKDTYNPNDVDAISGKGVAAALGTLDGSITGTAGASKTLSALSETDGIVTATFTDIAIANTQVSGLGDAAVKAVDSSITTGSTSVNLPTSAAVASYVDGKITGLTGAMHFKGELVSLPEATDTSTWNTYESGDVVLVGAKEYVYYKAQTANASQWILLGDEGSYALKTNTTSVGSASGWNAGSTPTLGDAITADDITSWSAGSASAAVVESGILKITNSTVPALAYTEKTIPNVTNVGTVPTLSVSATTVVVP